MQRSTCTSSTEQKEFMQINTLFLEKRQWAFIRAGSFIRINKVVLSVSVSLDKHNLNAQKSMDKL